MTVIWLNRNDDFFWTPGFSVSSVIHQGKRNVLIVSWHGIILVYGNMQQQALCQSSKPKTKHQVDSKVGSKVKITCVLWSNKWLAAVRAWFGGDPHGFPWSFCAVPRSTLKLCAVNLITLWAVLGSAVVCDGSPGLGDPFEARLPNACCNCHCPDGCVVLCHQV